MDTIKSTKLQYPLALPSHITQHFGENPQYYQTIGLKAHNGIDWGCPIGTPVYATHDGIITFAEIDSTMSLTVSIDAPDLRTMYCHLSNILVSQYQKVKAGDVIGLSGNTGRYTTGPHLHFGVKKIQNGQELEPNNGYNGATNPEPYFSGVSPQPTHKILTSLKLTDTGLEVEKLQRFLVERGYMQPQPLYGYYGAITASAVLSFQIKNINLSWYERYILRGTVCGDKTRQAINNLIQ